MLNFSKEKQLGKKKEKKTYRIPQISKKKAKRIKEEWTETKIFQEVFEQDKTCIVTGKRILEPVPWNFAHIFAKSSKPQLRLYPNNIALVYWIDEHQRLDSWINNIKKSLNKTIHLENLIIYWTRQQVIHFIKLNK